MAEIKTTFNAGIGLPDVTTQATAIRAQEIVTAKLMDTIRGEGIECIVDGNVELWKLTTADDSFSLGNSSKARIEFSSLALPMRITRSKIAAGKEIVTDDTSVRRPQGVATEIVRGLRRCRLMGFGLQGQVRLLKTNSRHLKCSVAWLMW